MPLDYKRVLEEAAAKAEADKRRESTLDLIPSQTSSQLDLVSGPMSPSHLLIAHRDPLSRASSANNLAPPTPPRHEPSVVDLEDSILDENATRQKMAKPDKLRGFIKYKRLNESVRPPRRRVKVSTSGFRADTPCHNNSR